MIMGTMLRGGLLLRLFFQITKSFARTAGWIQKSVKYPGSISSSIFSPSSRNLVNVVDSFLRILRCNQNLKVFQYSIFKKVLGYLTIQYTIEFGFRIFRFGMPLNLFIEKWLYLYLCFVFLGCDARFQFSALLFGCCLPPNYEAVIDCPKPAS